MTKPLEIIHQNFEVKLDTIKTMLQLLDVTEGRDIQMFQQVEKAYHEQTLSFLCDYYLLDKADNVKKCKVVDRYMQVIVGNNFVVKLDQVVQNLEHLDGHDTRLLMLFKTYKNTPVDIEIKKLDYKVCTQCEGKMNIQPQQSELRCSKCDFTILLKGTVFDDSHMFSTDGGLAKRGAYETSRHCRYHLERILAIKNPNIPDATWQKIDEWLERNNFKFLKLVTCPDYRRCLKEIKETKYNEHVPYIRQVKSGVSPERLFHHEARLLYINFEKAVTEFNHIKNGERANLKYYPYLIRKLIEMILCKPEDRFRLQSIVDCIHLQRDNTIVANDRLFEMLTNNIEGFTFTKTDKNRM